MCENNDRYGTCENNDKVFYLWILWGRWKIWAQNFFHFGISSILTKRTKTLYVNVGRKQMSRHMEDLLPRPPNKAKKHS